MVQPELPDCTFHISHFGFCSAVLSAAVGQQVHMSVLGAGLMVRVQQCMLRVLGWCVCITVCSTQGLVFKRGAVMSLRVLHRLVCHNTRVHDRGWASQLAQMG
jgi:hypothetical protein